MTFETCAQRGEGTSWLPNSIYSNFQRTNNDIAIKSSTGEHYGLWRWWWSVTYLIIQNVMSLPDKALKRRFFWNQPCQINFHFKCDAGETELFHSNPNITKIIAHPLIYHSEIWKSCWTLQWTRVVVQWSELRFAENHSMNFHSPCLSELWLFDLMDWFCSHVHCS